MKYLDGTEICLGDKVSIDGANGIVVAVIDSAQYSPEYSEGWSYLEKGALIVPDGFGLLHYLEADEDLVFISRSKN